MTVTLPARRIRAPHLAWLAAILAVAAGLRFWALGHGIPYAVGVDEPEVMERVVRMLRTGDFNPHFFHYPSLYFYLQLVVAALRFLAGAIAGRWTSLDAVTSADFYLWGRALTALFGTATVGLVYLATLRWSVRHAFVAAALMAVHSLHVRESHYTLTDVPMTFFVTLSLVLTLAALERPSMKSLAWAGAAVGLATATKYTAGVAIVLPLLAAIVHLRALPLGLPVSLAAAAGAYFVCAPYTVLDLPGFLNGIADLARSYPARGPADESGLMLYAKYLRQGLGWPALTATIVGLALAVRQIARGPDRGPALAMIIFPLMFLWSIADKRQIYGRYLLPMLPFACVLASIGLVAVADAMRRLPLVAGYPAAAWGALLAVVLAQPALMSVEFDRMIARPSTQGLAYGWIVQHAPRGSKILVETYGLRFSGTEVRADHTPGLAARSAEEYAADGYRYLIASSQAYGDALAAPSRQPERAAAYRELFRRTREVARFTPSKTLSGPELIVLEIVRD